MGRPLYTNNAATYLAFGITNTATTMQVSANAGSLFPNPTGGFAQNQSYSTATQGQTVFTVPFTYDFGGANLYVFVNGSKQVNTLNYTETSTTYITFLSGLNAGDIVEFITA